MSLKLNSSGGGSVTLQEPTTATNGTLNLPAGTGTVSVNGLSSNIVSATAQSATSGTTIDFTGIPSWVKRITFIANDISFAAAGTSRIRIGTSGGLVSTGYSSANGTISNANTTVVSTITDGFPGPITGSAAATATIVCTVFNVTGNTWTAMTQAIRPADLLTQNGVGFITLSGTLDRISLVATTSTFDAGTINILYE